MASHTPGLTEYQQLRAAGLSDAQITMLRNTGATHAAILMYARAAIRKARG